MGKNQHRRFTVRRARPVKPVVCFNPDKVRYPNQWRARAAARALGMTEYPCVGHWHLTSRGSCG